MRATRIAAAALGALTTMPVMAFAYRDALFDDADDAGPVSQVIGVLVTASVIAAMAVADAASHVAAAVDRSSRRER
ncbi:MAG: hypothetical protein AB7T06_16135 [Kofleriaceae bacterium]